MNQINTPYPNQIAIPFRILQTAGVYTIDFGKQFITSVTKNDVGDVTLTLKFSAVRDLIIAVCCIHPTAKVYPTTVNTTKNTVRIAMTIQTGVATESSFNGVIHMINQGGAT